MALNPARQVPASAQEQQQQAGNIAIALFFYPMYIPVL
jgi:hypothetical protein